MNVKEFKNKLKGYGVSISRVTEENGNLTVAYEDFKSKIEIKPSELVINDKGDKENERRKQMPKLCKAILL